MKLTHGRNAEEIARANTAILIELIKRLQAKGVLTADEAQVMLEDAASALMAYPGTQTVASVQGAAKLAHEMIALV